MKILDMLEALVSALHLSSERVARHDRDLGAQLRSAANSMALNASEGVWAKAGKRRSRLEDSLNSGRECRMALRIARACAYLPANEVAEHLARLDEAVAVLWVLAYRR